MKRVLLYILVVGIFAGCQNPPKKKPVIVVAAKRNFPNTLANKTRSGECSTVTESIKSRAALNLYLVKGDKGHLELVHGPDVI